MNEDFEFTLDLNDIKPVINGIPFVNSNPIKSPTINNVIYRENVHSISDNKPSHFIPNSPTWNKYSPSDLKSDRSTTSTQIEFDNSNFIQPITFKPNEILLPGLNKYKINESNKDYNKDVKKEIDKDVKVTNEQPITTLNLDILPIDEQFGHRGRLSGLINNIKERYPELNVPELKEFPNLNSMQKYYDGVMEVVNKNANISKVKMYVLVIFIAIEVIVCKYVKIDIGGFAKAQIRYFKRWEPLLTQISHRSYMTAYEASLPIEAKLAIIVVLQIGLVWAMNTFFTFDSKKDRDDHIDKINSFVDNLGETSIDDVLDKVASIAPVFAKMGDKKKTLKEEINSSNKSNNKSSNKSNSGSTSKDTNNDVNPKKNKRTLPM